MQHVWCWWWSHRRGCHLVTCQLCVRGWTWWDSGSVPWRAHFHLLHLRKAGHGDVSACGACRTQTLRRWCRFHCHHHCHGVHAWSQQVSWCDAICGAHDHNHNHRQNHRASATPLCPQQRPHPQRTEHYQLPSQAPRDAPSCARRHGRNHELRRHQQPPSLAAWQHGGPGQVQTQVAFAGRRAPTFGA